MKIIFSEHAEEQIKERKIQKKIIKQTIQNPQEKIGSFKNRELRRRKFGGRILEVVTVTEGNVISVITQYWEEKE